MQPKPSWGQWLMRIALLAAAYFAGGRTGLLFSDAVANIALVWPAAGIAVAMLVRFGWRYWPGVYIGSVAVEWSLGYSWWMSLAMGVTCTLGPLAAAFFLQGIGFQPQFLKRRDGLMLVAAGAGGTVLSAAGGVIALNLIGKVGWDQFGPSVFRWWLGDSAGVVMVAPLLLTWSRGEWRLVRKRGVEFGLVCAATLIGGWFVFFNQPPAGQVWQPLTFLTVPLVVWGALRFRPMGASFVSLLLCFVAVWALSWALGPFSNQSLEEQEFLLWTFIMMTSLTTLLVSSLEAERADDEGRLRQIQASLETAQAQAQLGNWELDVAAGCGWWSKEMFRLFRRDFDSGPPDLSEFMDMVHPDDRADLKESQRRVIETGVADCLHFRTNPARGPVRHFDSAFRRTDASGGGVKLIGTVQDVTERHLTEELKNEHAKVLEMIAQGAPLGETLDRLCRALSSQSEGMFCSILLLDEDGRHLRHGAAPGLPKEYVQAVDGVEIGPAVGCCGSAAYLRETVVAEDMRTDSRWANFQSLVEKYEMRSCWSTPIFDVGRRVLGTFAVYQCAPGRPTARQLRLIESATHSASICISHARASDVLRKSQQRLQVALETAHTGVWEWDIKTDVVTWSPECFEIFDMVHSPVSPKAFQQHIHPDDVHRVTSALNESVARRKPYAQEFRIRCKDGSERWIADYGSVDCDGQGNPVRMIGAVQNITQRKQFEEQLRQREQQFRAVVQNTPNVAVQIYDREGRVVFWNQASELIFGWKAGEAVGKTLDQLIHTKAEAAVFLDVINEIARTGKTIGPMEYQFRRHNGEVGISLSTTFAVPPVEGVQLFVCMDVDVTAQKRAEQDLADREKKYRDLFTLSPAGIILQDSECRIVEVNDAQCAMTGYTRSELLGRDIRMLVPPEQQAQVGINFQRILKGKTLDHEVDNLCKDGSHIRVHIRECLATLPQGQMGVLSVTQDVTERQQAQLAIQERLKLEERFSKLATTAPGVIYSFRLREDGRVCMPYASPSIKELSGYRPDELVEDAMKVFQRIHPDDLDRVWDSILESARQLTPWRQEFRVRPPGKGELWLEGRSTPERDPDGGVLWHGFLHDITPRKQAESDRQKLVAQLLHTEDDERRRIARELHDTTAQHLAAAKMNLTRLLQSDGSAAALHRQAATDSLALVEQAVQEIRTLTYVLHPPLLDELGLLGALRDYAAGVERRSGLRITVDADGYRGRLSHEIELVLFRVIQECLTNVLRHSGSASVLIRLERDDEEVRLEVQDSGRGLPPGSTKPDTKFLRRTGVGIAAMRERLRLVGGRLAIESDAEGVTVLAAVPAPRDPAATAATSKPGVEEAIR